VGVSDCAVRNGGVIGVWGIETVWKEVKVAYTGELSEHLPVVTEEYQENLVIRACATDIQTAHVRIDETLLLEEDASVSCINNRSYCSVFQVLHCVLPSGMKFNEVM
jgi:hypothetical protein